MIPQDFLTEASRKCLDAGVRVLQGFRLAQTEHTHVAALLDYMDPARGTLWADIGCGFGEPARMMHQLRPDLGFVLVNNNQFQLDYAPRRFLRLCADMAYIPLPAESVDGCMFLYSLMHADNLGVALREAARITRPGGALFVYDFERIRGDNDLMQRRMYARAFPFAVLGHYGKRAGWGIVMHAYPDGDDTLARTMYGNDEEYDEIFDDVQFTVWKAVRE
jgi:ubiquinone/menaquinone biosynthesis C-methylase UbiE